MPMKLFVPNERGVSALRGIWECSPQTHTSLPARVKKASFLGLVRPAHRCNPVVMGGFLLTGARTAGPSAPLMSYSDSKASGA